MQERATFSNMMPIIHKTNLTNKGYWSIGLGRTLNAVFSQN